MIKLLPEEKRDIYQAISMWINYVQTGDVCFSQEDAVNAKREDLIKSLSIEQMHHIIKLDNLRKKFMGV